MPGNSQILDVAGNNCFHVACWNGSLEFVKLFLESHTLNSGDAKVKGFDMQNSEGDTPLHYATRNGHLKIVVALLTPILD